MSYSITCPVCRGITRVEAYVERDTGASIDVDCYECGGIGIVEGYDEGDDF